MFDIDNKGHIQETGKCCFCGSDYKNYGNATWGYWSKEQEEECFGENKRCCDKCYADKIVPARSRKFEQVNSGKVKKFEDAT